MLLDYSQTIELRSVILVRPDDKYDQPVCIQIYKSVPVNPNNLIIKLNHWLIYNIWIKYQTGCGFVGHYGKDCQAGTV